MLSEQALLSESDMEFFVNSYSPLFKAVAEAEKRTKRRLDLFRIALFLIPSFLWGMTLVGFINNVPFLAGLCFVYALVASWLAWQAWLSLEPWR